MLFGLGGGGGSKQPLTPVEQAALSQAVREILDGTFKIDASKMSLIGAFGKVGISKEHIKRGLADWLAADPQAPELVVLAIQRAGKRISPQARAAIVAALSTME